MRRLIINADDLGLTEGVNRGIFECIRRGVVTSATLMANGGAISDAVQACSAVQRDEAASFGCHVVLVDGAPLCAPESVRTLLAGRQSFPSGFAQVAAAALRGRISANQLETEAKTQIGVLQNAGLRVSHVDSHKHVHVLPQILAPMLRAAQAAGVRAVRNPFAPIKPLALAHLARRPHLWKRYTEVKILRTLGNRFRQRVEAEGMVTTDGTFGIVVTGALTLELFEAIIGCIPEGTWEFCCHPGHNDADLAKVKTRLRESRLRELEVLTSDAARDALSRNGVELISYWDLG